MSHLTQVFPPEFVTATGDQANVGVIGEILSLFLYIFSTGPVRVWLDCQIGDNSVDKIMEEYAERRSDTDKYFGVDERPNLLPTENKKKKGGAVKRDVDEAELFGKLE